MRPKVIHTFTKGPNKPLANKLNLTFDKKFGYCISDAYNDDKGYPLPSYFVVDFKVYGLKYVDGCFNPYLVEYDSEGFSFTSSYSSDKPNAIFTANYTDEAMAKLRQRFPKLTN